MSDKVRLVRGDTERAKADKQQAEVAQIGIQPAQYQQYATSEHP